MKINLDSWIRENQIKEVECLVSDLSGIARGKILPAQKFMCATRNQGLRLPESIFGQTVTGDYIDEIDLDPRASDVLLRPIAETIRMVPWYAEPTAQIIHEAYYFDGTFVDIAARAVLCRVLDLYVEKGWTPIVAPELEFFLVKVNEDPDYPLEPPIGRSGRQEIARQAYGIDAVNEFDPLFEKIYDYCKAQEIDIDTLIHESGAAQMEINFNHGNALDLADQTFLFKRTVRQAALDHKIYATFMAKPMQYEPGSSMHMHISVVHSETGQNLFASKDGKNSDFFLNFIGGMQKYVPPSMALFAPYVNSYRRLVQDSDAPVNVHWGIDNRTTGFRVPESRPESRRVENRVPGADANPYLAFAASLACGYLGIIEQQEASKPVDGSAYNLAASLPRHLEDALLRLNRSKQLRDILGQRFIKVLTQIKEQESRNYLEVISAWERQYLLLNV
ncbi:glutamine synthetase, catalytic domain protein [Candidatus Endolissoclinum faulkneri L2]|uniref:Glutamine synthetase, catalytic domain protein n=1 Tax=Candidatus Endolissoclinum faulkneri L2 TaxID=1193729 RepID=K7YSF2_9PROT|nr:glutamine synthetase family protein [Candidatus Endolissoclinum faulkneri]AFX99434.1 glutamine synthetase, catalytic domain protein [Candidatus Endolissoclinum faulkneri L2]